ncbi:MAG: hypothetical protein M3O35_15960 [Acidobacteriota bacterium]|nr:hypothetical protein [Acidobacteriota bacterium]
MEVRRVLLGLVFVMAAAEAESCVIIETAGFKNAVVETGPHGLRPARTFRFKAGTAWNGDTDPAAHDWQASIKRDVLLRPEPGYTVRFLTVLDTHVADGETQLYVLGFECDDGRIKRVFDEAGERMRVERLGKDGIVLAFTTRQDPPVKGDIVDVRRVRFAWDPSRHSYVRREAAKPPPDFKIPEKPAK